MSIPNHKNLKFVCNAVYEKLKAELPDELFVFNTAPIVYWDQQGSIAKESQPYPAVHVYVAETTPSESNQNLPYSRQRTAQQTISIVCIDSAEIEKRIDGYVGDVLQRIDGFQVPNSRELIFSKITHDIYVHGFHVEHLDFITDFVLDYQQLS